MNELELLEKLIEIEESTHILDLKIQIWSNEDEKMLFVEEYKKGNLDIEELKKQLVEIDDKSFSSNARINMIKQLSYYIEEINKAKPGLSISRNQGLVTGNELFVGIVRDMTYLIRGSGNIIRIPSYLHYTTNPEDSVDIDDLTSFLETEILLIKKLEQPDYLKLRDYMEGFTQRLIERYIQD